MKSRIYLDYNATSPVLPDVCNAIEHIIRTTGNPSSIHTEGRNAKGKLQKARAQIADLVGCNSDQVIFTSGGTEANNLALSPLIARDDSTEQTNRGQEVAQDDRAITTPLYAGATEHISVLKGGRFAQEQIHLIPVNADGLITREALYDFLIQQGRKPQDDMQDQNPDIIRPPFMVSIMYANNETGLVQDVEKLGQIVHSFGGVFHVDAVQAAGKIKLDFARLPIDFMSISAHKIGGIQGAGALIARAPDRILKDVLHRGGGQEKNRRGGTENMPAIMSFGLAAQICASKLDDEISRLSQLRLKLEEGLKHINKQVIIACHQADQRLPNTLCFLSEGIKAENMLMVFDLAGIAVSSGSACSSGKVSLSHVLQAMGYDDALCASALRVSLGWDTRLEHVEAFLSVYADIVQRHKKYHKAA